MSFPSLDASDDRRNVPMISLLCPIVAPHGDVERSVEFFLAHGVLLNNTDLRACKIILASSSVTVVCRLENFVAF